MANSYRHSDHKEVQKIREKIDERKIESLKNL